VELTLTPELTDFEGFVNYGTRITSPASSGLVNTAVGFLSFANPEQLITPNYILQPVFKTQKVATSVKIWDGATVVLGGAKVQKKTLVDDRIPILGNMPFVGRFFRSEVTETETKNIIIFVTVDVIDPSGQKVNRDTAAVAR
jgi:general secretion pathway protein D